MPAPSAQQTHEVSASLTEASLDLKVTTSNIHDALNTVSPHSVQFLRIPVAFSATVIAIAMRAPHTHNEDDNADFDACNVWLITMGANPATFPETCTSILINPTVGDYIKFRYSEHTLPECSDPMEVLSEDCTPWIATEGWYFGDGEVADVEFVVKTALDDGSAAGNYILGTSVFTHIYPAAHAVEDGAVPYTAVFTSGGRSDDLLNNKNGLFRLYSQVKMDTLNSPPRMMFCPVFPVPKTGGVASFTVPFIDPDGDAVVFNLGTSEEYGGIFNFMSLVQLYNSQSKTNATAPAEYAAASPPSLYFANSATGTLAWAEGSVDIGMYNMVVSATDGKVKSTLDSLLYLYKVPSFCSKDCKGLTPGLLSVVDADGLYDGCTVCGNGNTTDYQVCQPVLYSQGCGGQLIDPPPASSPPPPCPPPPSPPPGEGPPSPSPPPLPSPPPTDISTGPTTPTTAPARRHLTQTLVPTADAGKIASAPSLVAPTPGLDASGNKISQYTRFDVKVERGVDITFDVSALDNDECVELRIQAMGMPETATFEPSSGTDQYTSGGTTDWKFTWLSPSANPLLDTRPAESLVCFFASDKYQMDQHCVHLVIEEIPKRPEQVLARFGCWMGLLWNPYPAGTVNGTAGPTGKFCFFTADADFALASTVEEYCTPCTYEDAMWHHAIVSIDEAGAGAIIVDGVKQKEFTTTATPVACGGEEVVATSTKRHLLEDGITREDLGPEFEEGAVLPAGRRLNFWSRGQGPSAEDALAALAADADTDKWPDSDCMCSFRMGQSCDLKYSGFTGFSDEIGVWTKTLTEVEVAKMMFGMPSGRLAINQTLCAGEVYDYTDSMVAYFRFDAPCEAPIESVPPVDHADPEFASQLEIFGLDTYAVHNSVSLGSIGSAFAPAGTLTMAYAATPYYAPGLDGVAGPGGEAISTIPLDSTEVTFAAVGVAPSPWVKCTLDGGEGGPVTSPPLYFEAGSKYTTEWRLVDADPADPELVKLKSTATSGYWGITEVTCPVPSVPYGTTSYLGVSNDGGMSRGTAIEVDADEMILELGGKAYVDASSVIGEITAEYTIGMWVHPSSAMTGEAYLLAFGRDGSLTTSLSYDGASKGFLGKKEQADITGSPFAAEADMWHFVTFVSQATGSVDADGRATTNGFVYVDGVSVGLANAPSSPPARDDSFYLGGFPGAGSHFIGGVDEVRVYSSALSAADVVEQMFGASLAFEAGTPSPSIVTYYRMHDVAGAVLHDSGSGVASDAALVNEEFEAISYAFTFENTPWEPTMVTGAHRECSEGNAPRGCVESFHTFGAEDMVGPVSGGTVITVSGANFVKSPFLKCVFGTVTPSEPYTLPEYVPTPPDTCAGPFMRPDGAVSTMTMQTAHTISGQETPAVWVDGNTVTCATPPMSSPIVMQVSVVNKPQGLPNAIYDSGTFTWMESSMELDGEDDYLDASALLTDPEAPAGAPIEEFTIAMWVLPFADNATSCLFGFQGSAGERKAMVMYDMGTFYYYDDGIYNVMGPAAAAGEWHYVAFTMDPSGKGSLYVDDLAAVTFTTVSRPIFGGTAMIGAELVDGVAGHFLPAYIDELRVWSAALPAAAFTGGLKWGTGAEAFADAALAYYQFADTFGSAAVSTITDAPDLAVVGGYWSLTGVPWVAASVYGTVPASGSLNGVEPIAVEGSNFAVSQWAKCSMGGVETTCVVESPDVLHMVPVPVTAAGAAVVDVMNDGVTGSGSAAVFLQDATFEDLHLASVAHLTNTPWISRGPFSPKKSVDFGESPGRTGLDGEAHSFNSWDSSPWFWKPAQLGKQFAFMQEDSDAVGTLSMWVKVEVHNPYGLEYGRLNAGSWKLMTIVSGGDSDSDSDYTGIFEGPGVPVTDPLWMDVYEQILHDVADDGTVSASSKNWYGYYKHDYGPEIANDDGNTTLEYNVHTDEMWLWDRPLSPYEIATLYHASDWVLDFDAVEGGYAVVESDIFFGDLQGGFSASFWAKPHHTHGMQTLMSCPLYQTAESTHNYAHTVSYVTMGFFDGKPSFSIYQGCEFEPCEEYAEVVAPVALLEADKWSYIRYTYASGILAIFVDGVMVAMSEQPEPIGLQMPRVLVFGAYAMDYAINATDISAFNAGGNVTVDPARAFHGELYNIMVGPPPNVTSGFECCNHVNPETAATGVSGDPWLFYSLKDGGVSMTMHETLEGIDGRVSSLGLWNVATLENKFDHLAVSGFAAGAGEGLVTSGQFTCLTLSAQTKCGKRILTGGLEEGDVAIFETADPSVNAPVTTELFPNTDGSSSVCFKSAVCGKYSLSFQEATKLKLVDVNGTESYTTQVDVEVIPGLLSAATSDVSGYSTDAASTCAGVPASFLITAKDAQGCLMPDADYGFNFELVGPHTIISNFTNSSVEYMGEGVFKMSYIPDAEGNYDLNVFDGAGNLISGVAHCVSHCPGHSLAFDGYGSVEIYEEVEGSSPLDLSGTPFTMEAWVKRNKPGIPPPPPAPPPCPPPVVDCTSEDEGVTTPGCQPPPPEGTVVTPEEPSGEAAIGRRHLSQAAIPGDGALYPDNGGNVGPDRDQYIFFKGGVEPHPFEDGLTVLQYGRNIKGYYLKMNEDYTQIEAGVYVPGVGVNVAGQYRTVTSVNPFGLENINCDVDARCNPDTDSGWVHITAVYDGKTFTIYTDGIENGQATWEEEKFGKPNMYYHPLSIGIGLAGQVDEARLYEEAMTIEQVLAMYKCPVHISDLPASLVLNANFNEGSGSSTIVYSALQDLDLGLLTEPIETTDRVRVQWAPTRPFSLVGVKASAAHSFIHPVAANYTGYVASASPTPTGSLHLEVMDQCSYNYMEAAEVVVQSYTYSYTNFPSTIAQFDTHTTAATVTAVDSESTYLGAGCRSGQTLVNYYITKADGYSLEVLIGGESIPVQPLMAGIDVIPGPAADTTKVLNEDLYTALMGVPATFYIQAYDQYNNKISVGGEAFTVDTAGAIEVVPDAAGSEVRDHGNGMYSVVYRGMEVSPTELGQKVGVTVTVGPFDLAAGPLYVDPSAGLDAILFAPDTGVTPGERFEHTTVPTEDALYMFGGVNGETGGQKSYLGELWKADMSGNHMYQSKEIVLLGSIGTVTKIIVDTTPSQMLVDCSDIRFTNSAGSKLQYWIESGCNTTQTEVYIRDATSQMHMFYWSAEAPATTSSPMDTWGMFWDFEEGGTPAPGGYTVENEALFDLEFTEAAAEGSRSLMVSGDDASGVGSFELDVSPEVEKYGSGTQFYMRAYFYDAGGAGEESLPGQQVISLMGTEGEELMMGLDSTPSSNSYKYYIAKGGGATDTPYFGFPVTTGSEEKMIRSPGWKLFEMYNEGTGVRLSLDGRTIVLLKNGELDTFTLVENTDDIISFVPTSIKITVGLVVPNTLYGLWDGIAFCAGCSYFTSETMPLPPRSIVWPEMGGWTLMAPEGRPPPSRFAHTALSDNDTMVVFGGERSAYPFNDLWTYDTEADKWSFHDAISIPGRMPAARYDHSTVLYDNALYVFGGRGVASGAVFADLWKFDMDVMEWTDISEANPLSEEGNVPALFGHSAIVHEGKMIVYGGYVAGDSACTSAVYEYEFATELWSKHTVGALEPKGRYGHTTVLYNGKMNVLGGANEDFMEFETWWQYDIAAKEWVLVSGIDLGSVDGRYQHAATVVGDLMLMFGGQGGGAYSKSFQAFPLKNV